MLIEITDEDAHELHYRLGAHIAFLEHSLRMARTAGREEDGRRAENLAALIRIEAVIRAQTGLDVIRPLEPLAIDVIREYVEENPTATRRQIRAATKYAAGTVDNALKKLNHRPPRGNGTTRTDDELAADRAARPIKASHLREAYALNALYDGPITLREVMAAADCPYKAALRLRDRLGFTLDHVGPNNLKFYGPPEWLEQPAREESSPQPLTPIR